MSARKVIANPYAKRKPTNSADSNHDNSTTHNHKRSRPSNDTTANNKNNNQQQSVSNHNNAATTKTWDMNIMGGSSFSQAFSSVEDSRYYQEQAEKRGNRIDSPAHQERAQQRALDATTTTTTAEASHLDPNLTDREAQVVGSAAHPHVLYVSPKQRGNIVLQYVRNVPTQFLRMVPDYLFSTTHCALFLSLKYHSLYPQYIHRRIAELQTDFVLRVLLVLVDVQDNASVLQYLNTLAVKKRLSLILAWSAEEAARYLESFKAFQGKDAALIQKRTSSNFVDQIADFLTACPGINKTDAGSLLGQFGSIQKLAAKGTPDELALVPGLGQVKIGRLWEAFHKPFSKKAFQRRKQAEKLEQQKQQHSNDSDNESENDSEEDKEEEAKERKS